MPEGVGYGSQYTASTGLGLNYIGNRVYAFSGSIAVDATEKDLLNFTTGKGAILCNIQFNYIQVTSEDFLYKVYLNDILVQGYSVSHSNLEAQSTVIPLIIPPFTTVKLTAQNTTDNNARNQLVTLTGKIV